MIIKVVKYAFDFFIVAVLIVLLSCNKDSNPPVITVLGSNPYIHCIIQLQDTIIYNEYIDEGATASDEEDGDLTASISSTSNVNIQQIGTYQINYSVKDKAGNQATATRTVNVEYCKK